MAAESLGDISLGRGGRSSSPSGSNNDCDGAGESGANAGAELGVAASTITRGDERVASAKRKINYDNGDYEGEVKDGKPHGKGVFRYANGEVYEGEWRGGKRHGKGVYRFANGNVYDGVWKNGLKHGRGTLAYANGHVYEGEFKEGKMHGRGVYSREHGEDVEYDGEWKDDKCHGTGTYHYEDGGTYVGEFENDLEHGKGASRGADWSYEGDWKEGNRHGKGICEWAGGHIYDGEWQEDKRHGTGTWFASGDVYEGQWVEGNQHGKGTMKYASGNVYDGEWVNGLPKPKEEVESDETTVPGASGVTQLEKEKRVYNHERTLRSTTSQQRRLQKNVSAEKCEHCGADDGKYKLRVCSGCNLALYCSMACQKAARGSHQRICDIISELPPKDAETLELVYDKEKTVDLDAALRYGTKYMGNLKHLEIDLKKMTKDDYATARLTEKQLPSLLKSKKGALQAVFWSSRVSHHGHTMWKELHGLNLKQLELDYVTFSDVQIVHDIVFQQKDTLMALCLPRLHIDWHKAKCRRTLALAVNSCKHLVKLNLDGCLMMDSDLKLMLQDLPNLRILSLKRRDDGSQGFSDNTCGLIARKCPGLQELNLLYHDHISAKGVRKILEGCPHLRALFKPMRKLSCKDILGLLDFAPQLMYLGFGVEKVNLSEDEVSRIIEETGGRTFLDPCYRTFDHMLISAKARETYRRQKGILSNVWRRQCDPAVANAWEDMLKVEQ